MIHWARRLNRKGQIGLTILFAVILLAGLGLLVHFSDQSISQNQENTQSQETQKKGSPLNATYIIDGQSTMLVNGKSEKEIAPGSASKTITNIFGTPTYGDINADGKEDAVIILTQNSGGSGTFYYVAAALNKGGVYQGTNAILLGDRIAPQTVQIKDGIIIANYADRNPGESMSIRPSLGVSKYMSIDGDVLREVSVKDDLIILGNPSPNSSVSSPIAVKGKARGSWYFEASFPLILVDWDGRIIAEGHAEAQGDWMTNNYVPFVGTLSFKKPDYGERGALILKKDNPSGLSKNDNALEVPILFK